MVKGETRNQIIRAINEQIDIFHPSKIAGLTGASVPYVNNILLSLHATGQIEEIKDGRKLYYKLLTTNVINNTPHKHHGLYPTNNITNPIQQFTVAERFDYVQKLIQMVIEGGTPSLFLTGPSGIGKTYLVKELFKRNNLKEHEDYVYIKGHSSPLGIYSTLYHNHKKIIVFDDCDKALDNEISISILKAALDSYDKRTVHWISRSIPIDSDMERSFWFEGKVIFVSNRELSQVDDTIRSRTLCINLAMTRNEITEYMSTILPIIEITQPIELRREVMDYLMEIQDSFQTYNLRTLIKAIRIRAKYVNDNIWKSLVKIVACNE